MLFIKATLSVAILFGLTVISFAEATTILAPVEVDTYILHGHGINNGYPDSHVSRATSWVGAESLFRFDLSGLDGVLAEQITSATFKIFTGEGTGSMATPVAPAGETQYAQVTALQTWDSAEHPYGFEYWTEAGLGQYSAGYIDGAFAGSFSYDPGNVGGIEPYIYQGEEEIEIEGDLNVIMTHNTGPNTWASVELADFVKAWLPGGKSDILNNGIRIHDLGGTNWDEWGWYFFTKDVNGTGTFGLPSHPGETYIPYLEIEYASLIPGDANCDGVVDGSDATILASSWQHGSGMSEPDATWSMGDFNHDGVVDGSDATILATNWQFGIDSTTSAVPEPSVYAMLLILAGVALFRQYFADKR